jgi:hypothetical protein
MDFVKAKNSLAKDKLVHSIVERISTKIKEDLNLSPADKTNCELLLMCCTLIENFVSNKGKKDKQKINKLLVLHEIYKRIFTNINQVELDAISVNVEMLLDRKMIKTYSFAKRIWKNFVSWCEKKLL